MMLRSIAVGCLCVVFSAGLCLAAEKKNANSLPGGLKGFSGTLKGTVVSVQDNARGFRLKVAKVANVWKNNKAEKPQQAVGRTFRILAQWVKADNGNWHPSEPHVKFIKSLKAGETIAIEVHNDEGDNLHVLELNKEQRKRAGL